MIHAIEVRNFQSLHHVSLELGDLTVIVGSTSSGKSALGRALRMLTSNARGTAFITHGQTVCSVTAHTDRGQVTLRKGKEDSYVIVPNPGDSDFPEQRTFTKLAGVVPEEVSEFLGIAPRDAINFAGQFDAPYLLDDTGNEVARTLGELTNVTMVFEAARESRRLGLSQSSTLRTRRVDLTADEARIEDFRPLKAQRAALEQAESLITQAGAARQQVERLDTLTLALTAAGSTLRGIEDLPPVPDIQRVSAARAAAQRLDRLVTLAARLRPVPDLPTSPPSAAHAVLMNTKLMRLASLAQALSDADTKIQNAATEIAAATKTYDTEIAEKARLADLAQAPAAFRTVSAWLSEQGPFGLTPEHRDEHTQTLAALKERS